MNLSGHLWTVGALAGRTLSPTTPPPSELWTTTLRDPVAGTVRLSGRLSRPPGARELVLLVHGLGGSSESGYLASTARTAHRLGLASLRFNLRGADGETADFYHGGLTADLHAAVSSLASSAFERIYVLGFSLGGHVVLRFATEVDEPSVVSVAAVCSPLDLSAGADAIDRRHMAPYRLYLLRRLKANYEASAKAGHEITARRGPVPAAPGALRDVRTLRHWDALTVVPRFGFADPDDYYVQASVGPTLDRLRRPALLVAAERDPMVPPAAIRPSLKRLEAADAGEPRKLRVRWLGTGGHLGFPRRLDFGYGEVRGVAAQCLQWLSRSRTHLDRP